MVTILTLIYYKLGKNLLLMEAEVIKDQSQVFK